MFLTRCIMSTILALGTILVILSIGEKREPITRSTAVYVLIFNALIIALLLTK